MCGWTGRELECSFVGQTTKTGAEKKKKNQKNLRSMVKVKEAHYTHTTSEHINEWLPPPLLPSKSSKRKEWALAILFLHSALCWIAIFWDHQRSAQHLDEMHAEHIFLPIENLWDMRRCARLDLVEQSISQVFFFFFLNLHWLFNYRRQDRKKSDAVNSMRLIRFIWWVRHRWK